MDVESSKGKLEYSESLQAATKLVAGSDSEEGIAIAQASVPAPESSKVRSRQNSATEEFFEK